MMMYIYQHACREFKRETVDDSIENNCSFRGRDAVG